MTLPDIKIIPAKTISGKVVSTMIADDKVEGEYFASRAVDRLTLDYHGIIGDYHHGLTRKSGGREPWYKRGTPMRNERQISILSVEELEEIRLELGLEQLEPGWIGGNLIVSNIPNLSYLPPRTLLMFEGGVTLRVDGYNAPCKLAGGEIARTLGADAPLNDGVKQFKNSDLSLAFVKAARMKRGLVAWVEREGEILPGEAFTARIWKQWVYE